MAAKKRSGGRVTPKGTQPATSSRQQKPAKQGWSPDHAGQDRASFGHGRGASGPAAPTRSGHHRGNR